MEEIFLKTDRLTNRLHFSYFCATPVVIAILGSLYMTVLELVMVPYVVALVSSSCSKQQTFSNHRDPVSYVASRKGCKRKAEAPTASSEWNLVQLFGSNNLSMSIFRCSRY